MPSPQFANQLAADGGTGLTVNQVDGDDALDGIRDVTDMADIDNAAPGIDINNNEDGLRSFGSVGECRQNFHCRGSEKCVRRNGKFM